AQVDVAPALRDFAHQRAAEGDDEGKSQYAEERRDAGEKGGDVRITEIEPRKAGEEPAAQPFAQNPCRGKTRNQTPVLPTAAAIEMELQRHIACEQQHEADGDEERYRRRCVAEVVNADVDPRGTDTEGADAVAEAEPRRFARRAFAQQYVEPGEAEEFQRPELQRAEGERQQGACHECLCQGEVGSSGQGAHWTKALLERSG